MFNPLVKNSKRLLSLLLLIFGSFVTVQSQVLLTATGASNSFTVQYPANLNAISGGMMVTFFSNQNITGSATLSLNGLAANGIFKNVNQPLSSGDILVGQPITVIFDGTYWQLLSTSANVPTSNLWTISGINLYPSNLTNKVGIGTASPQNTLHVVGGTRIGSLTTGGSVFATTNGDLYVGSIGGILGSGTPGGIAFWANNNTITSNGANLFWNNTLPGFGIGTSSPTALLDVSGKTRIRNLAVSTTATGLQLLQADALGNLSVSTSTSFYLWTLSGINIQPVNSYNINVSTTSGVYKIGNNTVVQTDNYNNIMLGGAGSSTITGSNNVFAGLSAGAANSSGYFNTFLGYVAGQNNSTARYNTFVGAYAGNGNTSGGSNTFEGLSAGQNNSSGSFNTFQGVYAGYSNTLGSYNSFFGNQAGNYSGVASGNYNTFLGSYADAGIAGLNYSSAIGYQALVGCSNCMVLGGTGLNRVNVGIGISAPAATLDVVGNINTLYGTTGGIYLNYSPFLWGDSGYNISLGLQSGNPGGASGQWNTCVGQQAGNSLSSGTLNTLIGGQAGYNNTTGLFNTFIGVDAGYGNRTGSYNNFIGISAGQTNVTGSNLVIIGYNANVSADGFTNAIAIGSNAVVGGSNTMVLGGTGANAVNVGIGTSTPTYPLDVVGSIRTSGYYYFNGTSAATGATQYLFGISGSYMGCTDHFIPNNSNSQDLGTSLWRWRTLYTNNNPSVSSDVRLKENISGITYGLNEVLQLRPVTYNYKNETSKEKKMGLIAQEVRSIIPEIVDEGNDSLKILSVKYGDLIPVLIKAVQELDKKLASQTNKSINYKNYSLYKKEIESIRLENENLKQQIETLRILVDKVSVSGSH
jgi:hypothetical protein